MRCEMALYHITLNSSIKSSSTNTIETDSEDIKTLDAVHIFRVVLN